MAPERLRAVLALLERRIMSAGPEGLEEGPLVPGGPEREAPALPAGLAVVRVCGVLVQRGSWLDAACGLTSYESVSAAFEEAMSRPEVGGILLEIDSPGGEVAGLQALGERIRLARGVKPVWAVANEAAFSAAYWLASAAERVWLPATAGVGSIGVLCVHVDQSAWESGQGLRVTEIHAGSRKVDGSPHRPLSEDARGTIQAEVDRLYGIFCEAVARHRGLTVEAVRGTEAGCFFGGDAVSAGLADGVMSWDEVVSALSLRVGAGSRINGRPAAEAGRPMKEVDMEEPREAVVAAGEGAEGVRDRTEVALGERSRVAAILEDEEARERPALARRLALETDLSPEVARRVMSAAAREGVEGTGRLARAMSGLPNPVVGPDAAGEAEAGERPGAMAASMGQLLRTRGLITEGK